MAFTAQSETIEKIKFGDMESWITRNIRESKILGGHHKTVYAIGPTKTIEGNVAYTPAAGNPWASSNVLANVMGLVKTSNAVSPGTHPRNGRCAVLSTKLEHCKAIGVIDVDVLVSGSIFLGQMLEPIKSTSNPYSKMEMGIQFTRRPKYLQFDYKLYNPNTGILTFANGKKTKTYSGQDNAEVFIIRAVAGRFRRYGYLLCRHGFRFCNQHNHSTVLFWMSQRMRPAAMRWLTAR